MSLKSYNECVFIHLCSDLMIWGDYMPIPKKIIQPKKRRRRFLMRFFVFFSVFLMIAMGGLSLVLYSLFHTLQDKVPSSLAVQSYQPHIPTRIYAADHQLIAEFYQERRIPVSLDQIPKQMVQAFLASEDKMFFEHDGVDYFGLFRSAVRTLILRTGKQGASTISMQVAKAFLDSETRDSRRGSLIQKIKYKLSQIILSYRLEQALSKQDILVLYLNHINLGHGAYGVQAAAENYFRKNVWDLTLGEIATIAGLPQSPSRYNPYVYPERAWARRKYVLRRMLEENFISEQAHQKALEEPIVTYPVEDVFHELAPHFVETVRQHLADTYGDDALYLQGLDVETTLHLDKQKAAEIALRSGLHALDKRQGFRGPLRHLPNTEWPLFLKRYEAVMPESQVSRLNADIHYIGLVQEVSEDRAVVRVGKIAGQIPIAAMRWARHPNPLVYYEAQLQSDAKKILVPGDVVWVKKTSLEDLKKSNIAASLTKKINMDLPLFALEQTPLAESALLSADPYSGDVVAMVGGYNFNTSELNRTMQSCRQPGSSFKPIIYSTAFDTIGLTPASILQDTPLVTDDPSNTKRYKPKNSHDDFRGDVTVRVAIAQSLNIPAIKTLEKTGVAQVVEYAKRYGITSELYPDLSLALGSSCVTMWDLSKAYGVFDTLGYQPRYHLIRQIRDRQGRILESNASVDDAALSLSMRLLSLTQSIFEPPVRVLDAGTSFVTVRQLMNAVQTGTGNYAARVGDFVAGKTGTTNDQYDAWFMGFSPHLVTGVWVGHDKNERPLGAQEFGGKAALPIWTHYMQAAIKGMHETPHVPPPGVVAASFDLKTGCRANKNTKKSAFDYFKKGQEPSSSCHQEDNTFYNQDGDHPF